MNCFHNCFLCICWTMCLVFLFWNVYGNTISSWLFQLLQKCSKRKIVHWICQEYLILLRKSKIVFYLLLIVLIMSFRLDWVFWLGKEISFILISGWQKGLGMEDNSLFMLCWIIWKHMFSIKLLIINQLLRIIIMAHLNHKSITIMSLIMKSYLKSHNCL